MKTQWALYHPWHAFFMPCITEPVSVYSRDFEAFLFSSVVCTNIQTVSQAYTPPYPVIFGPSSRRELPRSISIQSSQHWLEVRPSQDTRIFVNVCYVYLWRSWSNDLQTVGSELRKCSKHQRRTASLETKFILLWPFVVDIIIRIVRNDVAQVLQQRIGQKQNLFIDLC